MSHYNRCRIQLRTGRFLCLLIICLCAFSLSVHPGCHSSESELEARIKRVESGLIPNPGIVIKGRSIPKAELMTRMDFYKVPGVSLAVINDFEVEWSKGFGVLETDEDCPVTPRTLFQAASISKPVAALAALSFVQEGILDLDEDVNTKLVSWKIPENELTRDSRVTLRRILSHSAGLTVSGFPGYKQDKEVPSLCQILDGKKPANSGPIRVDVKPGTRYCYSGGGYTVLQQFMIDQANGPFPQIMHEVVLKPLGMENSTYQQPLPSDITSQAATGHLMNGKPVKGKWHTYPEMAAAGLWTTPTDLCCLAIELMLSKAGKSNIILSQDMTNEMLTPQMGLAGLGFFLEGEGQDFYFGHSGGNMGFKCYLVALPEKGQGVAVMTNGENGANLYQEILRSLAAEYGWTYFEPREKTVVKVTPEILENYTGTYQFSPRSKIMITLMENRLFVDPVYVFMTGKEKVEFFPEAENVFSATRTEATMTFIKDKEKRVTGIIFKQYNRERKAAKLE